MYHLLSLLAIRFMGSPGANCCNSALPCRKVDLPLMLIPYLEYEQSCSGDDLYFLAGFSEIHSLTWNISTQQFEQVGQCSSVLVPRRSSHTSAAVTSTPSEFVTVTGTFTIPGYLSNLKKVSGSMVDMAVSRPVAFFLYVTSMPMGSHRR